MPRLFYPGILPGYLYYPIALIAFRSRHGFYGLRTVNPRDKHCGWEEIMALSKLLLAFVSLSYGRSSFPNSFLLTFLPLDIFRTLLIARPLNRRIRLS
jgi:hypothetical protein